MLVQNQDYQYPTLNLLKSYEDEEILSPNLQRQIVSLRSLLASNQFQNSNHVLPIALGKNSLNEMIVRDLTEMPHLLISGDAGVGKTTALTSILLSLLYKNKPSQLKFILIDPKGTEHSIFDQIKNHFLVKLLNAHEAIISDTKDVVEFLNLLCVEMDNRFRLLTKSNTRNIKMYNEMLASGMLKECQEYGYLCRLVLVIDEYADYILTAGKNFERPLAKLAQLARATGIHLIISSQNSSVSVVTELIKANFPARLHFAFGNASCMTKVAAEKLKGCGDAMFTWSNEITLLQSPYVDLTAVKDVVRFIAEQHAYSNEYFLPEHSFVDS